jgi:putative tryptophan/tyrosine transport system substrate-binding protein
MNRRDFIGLLGGAAVAWPRAARAQPSAIPVVGFLHSAEISYIMQMASGFVQGLKETGYVEGESVAIEYRSANGQYDRLPALAEELVRRRVAVLLAAGGTEPAHAAMAATTTIPIVFVSATDPVAMGLVASLNRPGGNVTGVSLIGVALEAKRLELLHQLAPAAATLGALINPEYPGAEIQARGVHQAAASLGVKLVILNAVAKLDIDAAFATLARDDIRALLVAQDPFLVGQREKIAALAARSGIPVVYPLREAVAAGGLISYGADFVDGYRQAGTYVGRILKGAKPGDLPVLQPTKFALVINLKTAKALGLTIPPTLLATADEVIE